MRSETPNDGFRVGIAVDGMEQQSKLFAGCGWMKPASEQVSWDADENKYETYYVISGVLRIGWTGEDSGQADVGPGSTFYFAPGCNYTVDCVDEAAFVWAIIDPAVNTV